MLNRSFCQVLSSCLLPYSTTEDRTTKKITNYRRTIQASERINTGLQVVKAQRYIIEGGGGLVLYSVLVFLLRWGRGGSYIDSTLHIETTIFGLINMLSGGSGVSAINC